MPLERQAPCRKASTGIGGANLQIAIIQLAIVIDYGDLLEFVNRLALGAVTWDTV